MTEITDVYGRPTGTIANPLVTADVNSGANTTAQDFSANQPSLAGLNLLTTVPIATANPLFPRVGGFSIQNQSPEVLTIAFDNGGGGNLSVYLLDPADGLAGYQGGTVTSSMVGLQPGRIRIYGHAGSQVMVRAW
jgi:hypothetical protein